MTLWLVKILWAVWSRVAVVRRAVDTPKIDFSFVAKCEVNPVLTGCFGWGKMKIVKSISVILGKVKRV